VKSWGGLWPAICERENLFEAARRARRGKRGRESCAEFEFHLESRVLEIERDLKEQRFSFGPYRQFEVREPKPRSTSAAPYRDRVIHHAIMGVIEPLADRSFIADSYACRVGKGTHRALTACKRLARRGQYALKADIRHYFATIDHAILLALLQRRFRDRTLLRCLAAILASYQSGPEEYRACRGDDLFSVGRPRGIPIGNLTSQFFANFYLDGLDHFVQEDLRWRGYLCQPQQQQPGQPQQQYRLSLRENPSSPSREVRGPVGRAPDGSGRFPAGAAGASAKRKVGPDCESGEVASSRGGAAAE
jgi:retron-type reverse transcriptase